jgi:hypothetical protein
VDVTVAVMAHNPLSTMRFDLLERTVASIDVAFPTAKRKLLFDNASTDGSNHSILALALQKKWDFVKRSGANATPGAGRNAMLGELLGDWPPPVPAELFVMSDDDMEWHADAGEKLLRFWSNRTVPEELAIVSGLLEPEYDWNTPRGMIEAHADLREDDDGVVHMQPHHGRVLWRDSAPGCAWTFVAGGCHHGLAPHYFTMRHEGMRVHGRETVFINDFGYDYEYCKRLREGHHQLKVAQMDLAEHIGWDATTHGNAARDDLRVKPLDREKWGI